MRAASNRPRNSGPVGDEAVARAGLGKDHVRVLTLWIGLAPQLVDVHARELRLRLVTRAPDELEDLVMRERVAGVDGQMGRQSLLGGNEARNLCHRVTARRARSMVTSHTVITGMGESTPNCLADIGSGQAAHRLPPVVHAIQTGGKPVCL